MAASGDLINFDIIEAQKENIQALPSGRSAKKLAQAFSPSPLHKLSTPTPTDSKNVTDCIRAEYEAEIANISESDDPLDVYDRYVRWTFDAYPSAQATPQSQLHTLLERATKAFITSSQYKNDPRYLKLWILFIQFFADAPRETFLFISRHNIGENLALFYEEYAAWLETAGRWAQAEEVYKLGIERGARPEQRLMRKFKEFEQRQAAQGTDGTAEPSSPALPAMRPALAAKVDPFAAAAAAAAADENPQAPRPSQGVGGQGAKPGKAKMAIFSDASAEPSALSARPASSEGWDTIDSLANRKKENVMQAKPWVGETMKAGGKKSSAPKMQIFKDTIVVNPVNGKRERVFVDLEAIYPAPELPGSELSFEEVWAMNRGWLDHSWEEDVMIDTLPEDDVENLGHMVAEKLTVYTEQVRLDENGNIQKKGKSKKMKTMEVNETQIIKANLDSPSKPTKMKKRNATAEPTMTLHTKAATDDIYEIFNQPLKPALPLEDEDEEEEESDDDDDYETDGDGDYTSGAESTMTTTRQVDTSEAGDEETSDVKSVSEWSDFSTRRHVPDLNAENEPDDTQGSNLIDVRDDENSLPSSREPTGPQEEYEQENDDMYDEEDDDDLQTPIDEDYPPRTQTVFVPIPPEDYEPRTRPYRDPVEVANNRLPFMTPITERTESSLGVLTARRPQQSPTKHDDDDSDDDDDDDVDADELFSSPLREIYNDAQPARVPQPVLEKPKPRALAEKTVPPKGPIITDPQCNPVDDVVRNEILANIHPPMSSYPGFFDRQTEKHGQGSEIRRVAKLMAKARSSGERTSNAFSVVDVEFPDTATTYTIRKELGAGAFAPVYLVENSTADRDDDQENDGIAVMGKGAFAVRPRGALEALKMEQPPSAWEFHMIRLAHARLGPQHRAAASLTYAHEMHLYQDEGFLFLPLHPHGSLLDVVNLFRAEPSAVMDEQLGMFFTIELLRTVEALHARGLLHGDLKPDNCLLRLDNASAGDAAPLATQYRADGTGGWAARGVVLIDFGRGIDMRNFGPETQFVADWKTGAHDCAEMREGRPWTWQIDYHGLAGVIYCLLFGRYIETVRCDQGGIGSAGRKYRVRESLKRYWQTDIWGACFDLLLNPGSFVEVEDGRKMPVLRGLKQVRERMEAWLEENCERGVGLKSLIGKVEAHARARR
ncbi:hypothetical protein ACHAQA_003991 [Verticillium albo-atrum]